MNTTTTTKPTNAPSLPAEILSWPIDDIYPSPFQSRKRFEQEPLQEMANSMLEHGIIQPLTVRRVTPAGPLELVCGERRLRAGKLAGLHAVPIILRELTDAQAENIVLTENIQREDLTPSEEAHHYDRLLKLRGADGLLMHTRESVAKLASKKLNYIDDHLKLLACPKEMQEAVDKNEIGISVAMVVGRIPDPKLRPAAAAQVLKPSYQQVPMNVAQAKELVRKEFMVSLADVPWKLDDASLVPVKHEDEAGVQVRCFGGACVDCPFLSGNIADAAVKKTEASKEGKGSRREAGGSAGNLCTLPRCHRAKVDAVCKAQRVKALEKGLKVIDDAEAKKQFHPSRNEAANGAKYVLHDQTPEYHEVGQLAWSTNGRKWRTLLKGSEVPVVMGRNPHTGLLIEMSLLKEAKPVGEKALRAKKDPEKEKTKTPAELKEEEDRKKKRALELRQQKIDAITLPEALTDIRSSIERKGADARLLEVLCDMALQRAGSDGTKFVADALGIEREKKSGGYGLDKPIKKKLKELCEDRVSAWHGMLTLITMSWEMSYHGLKAAGFKAVLAVCGINLPMVEGRAKTMFEAAQNAKKGPSKPDKKAAKNSTDDSNWSADKEASKTTAADKRAKGVKITDEQRAFYQGNSKCNVTDLEKKFNLDRATAIELFDALVDEKFDAKKPADSTERKRQNISVGKLAPGVLGKGPAKVTKVAEEAAAKAVVVMVKSPGGRVEGELTPEVIDLSKVDVAAGAEALKLESKTITDLIGPKPHAQKDGDRYRAWNSLRMKLKRAAGQAD